MPAASVVRDRRSLTSVVDVLGPQSPSTVPCFDVGNNCKIEGAPTLPERAGDRAENLQELQAVPYWSRETSARDRGALEVDMRQETFSATVAGLGPWLLGAAVAFSAACGGADTTWETRDMPNDEAAATLGTAEQVRIDQPTVTARP